MFLAAEVEKEENKKEKKNTTEVVEKGEDVVVGRPMGSSEQGHEAKDGKRVEVAAASEKDVAPKSAELTSYGSSSPNEVAKSGLKPNKVVMHFERNHSIDEDASSSALLLRQIRYTTTPFSKVRSLRGAGIYRGMSLSATKIFTLLRFF